MQPEIKELAGSIGLAQLERESAELDAQAAAPGFWDDMDKAQKISQHAAIVKSKIDGYHTLCADYDDALTLIELADEAEDLSVLEECTEAVDKIRHAIDKQRLATLLSGEYDSKNAIMTFHAGAGGNEEQDLSLIHI